MVIIYSLFGVIQFHKETASKFLIIHLFLSLFLHCNQFHMTIIVLGYFPHLLSEQLYLSFLQIHSEFFLSCIIIPLVCVYLIFIAVYFVGSIRKLIILMLPFQFV